MCLERFSLFRRAIGPAELNSKAKTQVNDSLEGLAMLRNRFDCENSKVNFERRVIVET